MAQIGEAYRVLMSLGSDVTAPTQHEDEPSSLDELFAVAGSLKEAHRLEPAALAAARQLHVARLEAEVRGLLYMLHVHMRAHACTRAQV